MPEREPRRAVTVGFVGVGRLGRHLAASLLRSGFPLVGARPRRGRGRGARRARRDRGHLACRTSRESADTVITCLPSPVAVADVVDGRGRRC